MKKLFAAFTLLIFCTHLQAQKQTGREKDNGDVVFEDGVVYNFKMLENDPSVRVDWTALGTFLPTYFEKNVVLSLGLKGSVNLGDRVELHGLVSGGLHLDINMPEDDSYKSLKKQYQHHFLETSIKLFESESIKKTSIHLGTINSGYVSTSYMVSGKLKYKSRYGLVVGVDYSQRRVASDQYFDGPIADTNINGLANHYYQPLTLYQTSLRLGVDITWITSSLVEIDGIKRVDYQHARMYSMVLLPMSQQLDVVRYSSSLLPTNEEAELAMEDQYTSPGFTSLGYLLGVELINELNEGYGYFGMTLEVGILPGMKYDKVFDNFTASLGLSYGFGSNLTNSWKEKRRTP